MFAGETNKEWEDGGNEKTRGRGEHRGEGFAEGFGIGMHDARSEITGFAEPAIMAL